ncbi:MAG: deoxyguanosinetriphosphate triphosphohydrolase [Bacillota bacterium]|jgi:dGTPase
MTYFWNEIEKQILAPQAALAVNTQGREKKEEDDKFRTCFQRDRDRIIHSKSFRRLKTKTQVFIKPYGDHFRTRLTHTLEVMQISRSIARALHLNEDLTEAIALGHDLGHTPFGHAGERALAGIVGHFRHNEQSLRMVDVLEKDGKGLNLTFEVRDGILNHSGDLKASTLEGRIVSLADRIAYVNHDIDDALRGNLIKPADLPRNAVKLLGSSSGERIDAMVVSVIKNSVDLKDIKIADDVFVAMDELRNFLFERVYRTDYARELELELTFHLQKLFSYYLENINEVPEFIRCASQNNDKLAVCDYIAGMSDDFAFKKFSELEIM